MPKEKQKNASELTRLLYVACTRAKQSLHLLGTFTLDEAATIKAPAPLSLLGQLWLVLNIKPEEILAPASAKTTLDLTTQRLLKRLPAAWQAPIRSQLNPSLEIKPQAYSYHWQLHPERVLGTVIHRLLYQISQDGLGKWDREKIRSSRSMFARLLAQHGLLASQIPEAIDKLTVCLEKTLTDPRGRWILSQQHQAAQSEYAITALLHGKLQNYVIDRTFIDTRTEVRWIIDYKTTEYKGDKPEEFLTYAMQQHQQQLNTYAQALLLDKQQTIRCGLYFPLTSLWCEWEYTETSVIEST